MLRILFFALVFILFCGAAHSAAGEPADEQALKQAGVATDDAGLLNFFRTGSANEDQVRDLVKKLGDESFEVREKASHDLTALGHAAVPILREALKSTDAEVVFRAQECLKSISAGPSGALVSAAARLLARRKPAGAAEVLLAYLPRVAGGSSEEDVRGALVTLALRDGKPEPLLLKALEDKGPARRAAAAVILTRAGARDALPAVRKLLQDTEPEVRLQTALALVPLKEKEAVPALIDLLADLPRVRHGPIEDALCQLAEDKAPDPLVGDDAAARKKYRDAWSEWWKKDGDAIDPEKLAQVGKFLGYTMVVMLDAGRVLEVDAAGKTRWQIDGLGFPLDAERLPRDRVLVAEQKGGRVTERDRKGAVVWEKRVDQPLVAQRLPNGNTFIATRNEALEVDPAGRQVSSHVRAGDLIMKAQKLDKGDVALIVTGGNGGAEYIRLDPSGKEVTRFAVDVRTSGGRIDVQPNGHVLVPLKDQNKIVEYDGDGKVVWQVEFPEPVAVVRLPNGHTMATSWQDKRAVELDGAGKTVWEYKGDGRVTRAWRR